MENNETFAAIEQTHQKTFESAFERRRELKRIREQRERNEMVMRERMEQMAYRYFDDLPVERQQYYINAYFSKYPLARDVVGADVVRQIVAVLVYDHYIEKQQPQPVNGKNGGYDL